MVLNIRPLQSEKVIGKRKSEGIGQVLPIDELLEEINKRTLAFVKPRDFTPDYQFGAEDGFNVVYCRTGITEGGIGANIHVPEKWAGKQLKVTLYWMPSASNGGNILWFVEIFVATPGANYTSETKNFPVSAMGNELQLQSVSVETTGLSLKPGDMLGFAMQRKGADASDTATDDAYFLMMVLEEI